MEQNGSEDTKANAGAPTEQKARKSLSGLAVRTAYGLGYAAIFIGCLALGRYTTAIWVAIMSVLCCFEFYRMMRRDGKVPNEQLGLVAAALFPISALLRGEVEIGVMFLLMLAVGLWYVWSPRTRLADVAVTFFGPVYTGFMLSAIVLTRVSMEGFPGALLSVGHEGERRSSHRAEGAQVAERPCGSHRVWAWIRRDLHRLSRTRSLYHGYLGRDHERALLL